MKYLAILIVIAITLFLHHFPTYYASTNTPEGYTFSGQASWFDPWDINVYVSAIKEGQSGKLLYNNQFTTTEHKSILVYPLYTTVGFIFRNIDPFILFHLLAAICGILLICTIYYFVGLCFKKDWERAAITFLIANGGGVGWLVFQWISLPDMISPVFTLYEGFQRGHVAIVLMCYYSSLLFFYLGSQKKNNFYFVLSGLTIGLSLVFHPYNILSYSMIILTYAFYRSRQQKEWSLFIPVVVLLSGLFIVELGLMKHLLGSVGFGGLMGEQIAMSNPIVSLLTYSPLIIVSFSLLKFKQNNTIISFLVIWLVISFTLSFIPAGFSFFYLRGLVFPLTILAFLGIRSIKKVYPRLGILIFITLFLIGIGTKGMIFYKRISEAGKVNSWIYIAKNDKDVLDYLDNTNSEGGVLSEYYLGNLIPAKTNNRVFYGHNNVTPHALENIYFLHYFYGNNIEEKDAHAYLKETGIDLVVYSPREQAITKQYQENIGISYAFLHEIFRSGNSTVYRVE